MTPVENIRRLEALTPFETSSLLKNEHPQIIALTLSILDPNYSGKVLCHFTQRLRNDVVLRVSTIDRVTVRWLNVLSVSIGKTIDGIGEHRLVDLGGSRTAAAMIKTVGELDPYEEVSILDSIREYDPDLALILDETFTFDDLKNLHPAHLSLIFKEVKSEALACALNKTEEPFRGLILGS